LLGCGDRAGTDAGGDCGAEVNKDEEAADAEEEAEEGTREEADGGAPTVAGITAAAASCTMSSNASRTLFWSTLSERIASFNMARAALMEDGLSLSPETSLRILLGPAAALTLRPEAGVDAAGRDCRGYEEEAGS
jgi:hypothetical protein